MLLSPQDGHKRPYIVEQGPSRSWGRMRTITSKALLPFLDTSALSIQLQLIELPLVELTHSCLCRQNSIEIVAPPLHPTLVKILAVLHCDESGIQKVDDAFHCGVLGHACFSGDGVITGMAGVRPAILDQQEIGVDHERRGRKVQQKNLVWQSEKLSAVSALESGSVLIGDEPFTNQTDQIFFHRDHCHVDALRDQLWR